ncbi:MAG: aminotransferase class I/II-fold pyridoxal phosphate-dependent enzyme, partial [Myxococcota bacterium]|nr:aminotransferase class I/II-fold pyridoxal phosphate-dependent enzyme [Myxococcota bacterium]
EQARQVLQVILSHDKPLVVVCDDAYQGMLWEPGLQPRSLFYGLLEGASDNLLPIKIDGATKELLFFGGRVGFLTFGVPEEACSILDEKARACARATVSSAPTPSQALVLSALNSDDTGAQIERAFGVLQSRYQSLRRALDDAGIGAWPFNSGCFALVGTERDPQQLRRELIEKHSVGLVAIPSAGALRIAYCSLSEAEIPALVERLAASLG